MSGCAGVMSNQTAKPAKPAPDFEIMSIAVAGTIFERIVPNKSTNETRKYLTPFSLAYELSDAMNRTSALVSPVRSCVVIDVSETLRHTWNPVSTSQRHPCHGSRFDGEGDE